MKTDKSSRNHCDVAGLRTDIEKAILTNAGLAGNPATDPEALLRLIDATCEALEVCATLQRTAVHQARRADIPWSAIGEWMGMTRQAAQQRFAPEEAVASPSKATRNIYGAHAFNEMQILETEGRAGFHLVDFGALYLTVMASDQVWEHRRVTAVNILAKRARMEAAGWTYVGSWFPFHYFKRILPNIAR
jgi:hypothetical protein